MKQKYGGYITEPINQLIARDASAFVEMGVFERMAMGIRKYRKQSKKKRKQSKKKRRQSKKKRRQSKKKRRQSKKKRKSKRMNNL